MNNVVRLIERFLLVEAAFDWGTYLGGTKMVKKTMMMACLVAVFACPALAQRDSTRPDGPAALARRCVGEIDKTVHRTTRYLHGTSNRCVNAIGGLLEEGEVEMAAELARNCTDLVNKIARRGNHHIDVVRDRCIAALTEIEAPDPLIKFVQRAARAGHAFIVDARDRALGRIAGAIGA